MFYSNIMFMSELFCTCIIISIIVGEIKYKKILRSTSIEV